MKKTKQRKSDNKTPAKNAPRTLTETSLEQVDGGRTASKTAVASFFSGW